MRYMMRKSADPTSSFTVAAKTNHSRNDDSKVSSVTIEVTEGGTGSASDVHKMVGKHAPRLYPLLVKYNPIAPIATSITMENLRHAFTDVSNRVLMYNMHFYNKTKDVQQDMLSYFTEKFGFDNTKVELNSTLLSSIAKALYPETPSDNKRQISIDKAFTLERLQKGESKARQILTASRTANRRTLPPIIEETQWTGLTAQAKRHFIAYTPSSYNAKNLDSDDYRLTKISSGQSVPGRLITVTVAGKKQQKYIEYMQISNSGALYDRTVDSNGNTIDANGEAKAQKHSEELKEKRVSTKDNAGGFTTATRTVIGKRVYSEDELKLIQKAKDFLTARNIPIPKSNSKLLEIGQTV